MPSIVEEKTIEKKYAKLKVFAGLAFKYAVYLAVLFWLLYSYEMNVGADAPLERTMKAWLILLAVSVLGIIVKMAMEKDVVVTVLRKSVDITVGDDNSVFPIQDFIGPNINKRKKKSARFELVFAGGEGSEEDVHVTLPGVNIRQFKEISDAVTIAKKEFSGGTGYTAFEGELYENGRRARADVRYILLAAVIIYVIARMIWVNMQWLFGRLDDIGFFVLYLVFLSLVLIFFLAKFVRRLSVKEPHAKALRTLRFDQAGLTINGKLFAYRDIESVTMTPPYLTDFPQYQRILSVKTYDAKKPVRYSLGNRLRKDETESMIASRSTCEYPALYERIKTDKAFTRKFRI